MAHTSFTLSGFLRHSGEVLAAADLDDVVLTRRDGENLVLTTAPRATARREGLGGLARVVREAVADAEDAPHLVRHLGRAFSGVSYLDPEEGRRFLAEVAEAAGAAAELGATEPLARALARWRHLARSRARERPISGHSVRPVAIPDDVDDPSIEKASGIVELPLRVRWSHPPRRYDLDEPRDLRRMYEQVLREGTDDDVRRFIDVDTLVRNWDQLVVPPRVRRAWAEWLRRRRSIELKC